MTDIVELISEAQALTEDQPFPIKLEVWRGGIDVVGWLSGKRYVRRVTWTDISQARINTLSASVDLVSEQMIADYKRMEALADD